MRVLHIATSFPYTLVIKKTFDGQEEEQNKNWMDRDFSYIIHNNLLCQTFSSSIGPVFLLLICLFNLLGGAVAFYIRNFEIDQFNLTHVYRLNLITRDEGIYIN